MEQCLIDSIRELREEVHSLALHQHIMNEKLAKITADFIIVIIPSEHKKPEYNKTFLDLMEMFGFGRENIASKVEDFVGEPPPVKSAELDYTFRWDGQEESASYEPLQKHLSDCGINTVKIGEGEFLPDGLLYYKELWTLKKNASMHSEDFIGEKPILKYILQGRTDLVRTKYSGEPLGMSNNRYFIKIVREKNFVEEDSLREAVLQLIGGNASNYFHSPPVLLTNLAKRHYVMYITLVGNPTVALRFKLNVIRMPSFGVAMAFLEERTAEMKTVTMHFGSKPYLHPKVKNTSETDEVSYIAHSFGNAQLLGF